MTSIRQRMTEDMQVRNLSPHTQVSYVQRISLFARHFTKSPEVLGPEEIRTCQVHLTNQNKLAPGSILIAVAALRFLYKVTLKMNWTLEEIIPAPKKPYGWVHGTDTPRLRFPPARACPHLQHAPHKPV